MSVFPLRIARYRCFCETLPHQLANRTRFFFQAEDGIRDLVRSRGLGDVYKRQNVTGSKKFLRLIKDEKFDEALSVAREQVEGGAQACLLYTSDAADERSSVDLGGRRIIKKKSIANFENRDAMSHMYSSTSPRKYT